MPHAAAAARDRAAAARSQLAARPGPPGCRRGGHAVHARRTPHGARRTADAAAARDHAARRPRPPQSRRSAGTRLTVAGSQTLIYFYYPFVKLRFFRTESHGRRAACDGARQGRPGGPGRSGPHAARRMVVLRQ
jgi:hypothetical protein